MCKYCICASTKFQTLQLHKYNTCQYFANTIQLSANDILKNSNGKLILDYDTDTLSKNTAVKLEVQTDSTGGITQTSSGLKLKLLTSSGLQIGTDG